MRRIRLRLAAMAVLATASGITGVALAPAIPAGAVTSCTGTSTYTDSLGHGHAVLIPTIGNNTYRDNCQLGLGNYSSAVYFLQEDLNRCYSAGLKLDGIYGPRTQTAVENAQFQAGIPDDGIYGPQTRDHILWYDTFGECARL
jgi:peptidoglycan hydrolase-like protein with peptidoglycan-binding domain